MLMSIRWVMSVSKLMFNVTKYFKLCPTYSSHFSGSAKSEISLSGMPMSPRVCHWYETPDDFCATLPLADLPLPLSPFFAAASSATGKLGGLPNLTISAFSLLAAAWRWVGGPMVSGWWWVVLSAVLSNVEWY